MVIYLVLIIRMFYLRDLLLKFRVEPKGDGTLFFRRNNTVVAFMISILQSPVSSTTAFLVQRNAENDKKYVEIHNDANCTNRTFIGPVFNW